MIEGLPPRSRALAGVSLLSLLGLAAGAAASPAGSEGEGPRLTLDRLYSLPRLIGTTPEGFAWSRDGRRLAFLWNEEGFEFRDVWVLEVTDTDLRPVRVTRMPQEERPTAGEGDAVAFAEAVDRWERDRGVTAVTWHPDGERLLVTCRGDLWLLEPPGEPRRLTETEAVESAASFSPDGAQLAYLRAGDLWVAPVDGAAAGVPSGEPRLQPAEEDVRLSDFAWSPDGSRIAVLEEDRRRVPHRSIPDYLTEEPVLRRVRRAYPGEEAVRQRLGVLALPGGKVAWVDFGDPAPDMILGWHWSPDGRRLAADTSDLYAKDRRLFVAEVGGEGPPSGRLVARDLDPHNETFYFWRTAWATDSRGLYFLSDREEDHHVYRVPVGGEVSGLPEPRRLTRGPWAVAEMFPVEDGLIVVSNRGRGEERHLFRVEDRGGEPVRLSVRPGTHAPVVAPRGRHAAVSFSSDTTPPDLFLTALDAELPAEERERRVTTSPVPEFAEYRWVAPRYVTFPSHLDNTTLHGRLTLPPDLDPGESRPAILGSVYTNTVRNQWGGRTAHPTWGLDQYLVQEGYVLLNVDMRGSWGRGREHRRGIRLNYGGMDVEDLESGVRFLATLGSVDMERVGIWGSSYGGLMTAMSLFRKPELYAAGVAAAPATNVWHALTGQMAVMMRPQDRPEEYADSSPFLHAHSLEDPLLIIHGMRDRVVLFKDSVVLAQRLLLLGKDVDLVVLPDAGHGWDLEGLAQTRFAFGKLVEFFDRHLREEG